MSSGDPGVHSVRAVRVTRLDGPAALEVATVPAPVRPEGHYLVDVHAVGLAFPDLLLSRGRYQLKPDLPFTLGVDFAGVVREAPSGAGIAPGGRVAGWLPVGAAAEAVAAPATHVFHLPDATSFAEGACLPLNYLTAHYALVVRGEVRAGTRVLVHGAAGGVGTATVQVAKWLGAEVVAVVSSPGRAGTARRAGADHVVEASDFLRQTRDVTGGAGVDVVVDTVGGDELALDSVRCLAPLGRLLVLGFASGSIGALRLNRLLLANVDVRGVAWGPYTRLHPEFPAAQWAALTPGLADGSLRPQIHATYPLDRAVQALLDIEERRAAGKVVLLTR
ncbi:NADPH:quinone oxidoreductase family protein [Dactylosporangium sp. NPDC006015]|uniref:NADPH:quinone oxidoreductase family protein n=1 Tax=Dactylosporangium sp. NPDC006015 TaxID=3154576 RepID=UPI00339F04D5